MQQIVDDLIQQTYSQGIYCSKIIKNEELDLVHTLGAVSPIEIVDNNSFTHIKFIRLPEIGRVVVSKEGKIKFATDQSVLSDRIVSEITDIRSRTENIVLYSIYDKLVKIAMIRTLLNPIYVILKEIHNNEISNESLKDYPLKYMKYFEFLTNIQMIRKSKEGFVEGNNFIQIKKFLTKEDEETVLNKVFGYTINEGKYYLIDNLKFNILKPFIRISTVFYMPSIQLKDAISISKKELYRKYTQEYDMNTKFTQFEGMLDQLNRAEILKEKKGELLVVSNILKNIHRNMSIDKNLSVIYSY